MNLIKILWGTARTGEPVYRYHLSNSHGMSVDLCNIGCSILRLLVPDKYGTPTDVSLGYQTLTEYEHNSSNFGCIVGRYGNRIRKGQFSFHGKSYQLETNDRGNHLHGASDGFAYRFWTCTDEADDHVTFRLESPDGDGGYPGSLTAEVTYRLSEDNALTLSYHAETKTAAFCNLTNHNYFNLSGAGNDTVLDHEVMISSDSYTETEPDSIPTGRILPVDGTPLDFRKPKPIGQDIHASWDPLIWAGGYDHNFVLTPGIQPAASVYAPKTGIFMEVLTTSPGMQFYTGNGLNDPNRKDGKSYMRFGGFCMETQFYPDSINHPEFPSCELTAGHPQESQTTYRFSCR